MLKFLIFLKHSRSRIYETLWKGDKAIAKIFSIRAIKQLSNMTGRLGWAISILNNSLCKIVRTLTFPISRSSALCQILASIFQKYRRRHRTLLLKLHHGKAQTLCPVKYMQQTDLWLNMKKMISMGLIAEHNIATISDENLWVL